MKRAVKEISDLFETPHGPNKLNELFKYQSCDLNNLPVRIHINDCCWFRLCNPIDVTNKYEKTYLFKTLAIYIRNVAQNYLPSLSAKSVCDMMVDQQFENAVSVLNI